MNKNKPRHQQAAEWAEELDERLRWMTPIARRLFLIHVLTLAVRHLEVITLATIIEDSGVAAELVAGLTRALDDE